MNDWWLPVLLIAALLWFTRRRWKGWFSDASFGSPPYQPSQRFQDYDEARKRREERDEVDRILEKIAERGIESLSTKEKKLLEEASKREKRQQP